MTSRRTSRWTCIATLLLASCAAEPVAPTVQEIRSGSGSLSLRLSGAITEAVDVDGAAWYEAPTMTLRGSGAIAQSTILDFTATHGVRSHLVWAQFTCPAAADTLVLNVVFNVYDSTAGDPLLLHGAAGIYPSSTEDTTWQTVSMPYRHSQVDLLIPTGPVTRDALQFGTSRSSERSASYGRYFSGRSGEAHVEITAIQGSDPLRLTGTISGRLTDATGATVTLDRAEFSIDVPRYSTRRF